MANILPQWLSKEPDFYAKERKAEQKWVWILTRHKISDVLAEPENVRSIASHWGKSTDRLNPQGFMLEDLDAMCAYFTEYIENKGKDVLADDIRSFCAWKFWEAKICYQKIISPEIHPIAIAWQHGKIIYAGQFEALNSCLKNRRYNVAKLLAEKLHPGFKEMEPKEKKVIIERLQKEVKEIFGPVDRQLLDDLKQWHEDNYPRIDKRLPPKFDPLANRKEIEGDTENENQGGED